MSDCNQAIGWLWSNVKPKYPIGLIEHTAAVTFSQDNFILRAIPLYKKFIKPKTSSHPAARSIRESDIPPYGVSVDSQVDCPTKPQNKIVLRVKAPALQ